VIVNKGNAHHNVRLVVREERSATGGGGGNGTLGFAVMSSLIASLISMSTLDVVIRAALVVVLATAALMLLASLKPASTNERTLVEVEIRPTRLHREPETKHRLRAAYQLVSGGVVVGALVAMAVTILLAYLVGIVTGLLT
jgi:hypothetical protein